MCAAASDDPPDYFAEVAVEIPGTVYTWAEIYLDNVDTSAEGPSRVENAGVVVRMWFGDEHFDVPYADVVATLEQARTRLLAGESRVSE
jgi:hypothetical protein